MKEAEANKLRSQKSGSDDKDARQRMHRSTEEPRPRTLRLAHPWTACVQFTVCTPLVWGAPGPTGRASPRIEARKPKFLGSTNRAGRKRWDAHGGRSKHLAKFRAPDLSGYTRLYKAASGPRCIQLKVINRLGGHRPRGESSETTEVGSSAVEAGRANTAINRDRNRHRMANLKRKQPYGYVPEKPGN